MTNTTKKFDVAEMVTGKILESMKKTNRVPWSKPWTSIYYQNAVTGHNYRGINVLMLALFGTDTHYLTFNQVRAKGGKIREGSKAQQVVYWNILDKKDKVTKEKTGKMFFLRYYNVFALKDVEGTNIERKGVKTIEFNPIERAESIAKACGVPITHGGNRAYYSPGAHRIQMPLPETFKSVEAYYCTLFHEITHAMAEACGEKHDGGFGSEPYAKEELVAEMGANFLLTYCGIDSEPLIDNSAAYLENWMGRIASEPKLVVSAAGKAQKRFDKVLTLLGVKAEPVEETESELTAA